ncbi:spermidine synthase [Pseudonocardia zijingensis]|uniref:Spermidine synthase n=1 Tax=Pseudonocardia zijingensis TaxID=153376 RepID=A0ABP4AWG2_9PSEU
MSTEAQVVERTTGHAGELVLRRVGDHHEIVANGVFLMDTRGGSSERLLVTATADRMPAPGRMLIGGLGVGFSLAAALKHPAVTAVEVVEREPAVVRWNRGHLAPLHGDALADPRVTVREADVADRIATAEPGAFDAICLDTDNGPDWLVSPANARLYTDSGLAAAARALAPGGVLAVWSAAPSPALVARMGGLFTETTTLEVPVERGAPDVVTLGVGPRREG